MAEVNLQVLLVKCAHEAGATPTQPTRHAWCVAAKKKYPHIKKVKGKYTCSDSVTIVAVTQFFMEKLAKYKSRSKPAPRVEHTRASSVVSGSDCVTELQVAIKKMRDIGYTVECSFQAPARKL